MKKAFTDQSGVLTCWGYVDSNNDDTPHDVADDFNLQPGRWRLVSGKWKEYTMPVPAPTSCSAAQGLMAMDELGILDTVETLVEAGDRHLQIAFTRAQTFDRDSRFVQEMKQLVPLTEDQLDELFKLAVTL